MSHAPRKRFGQNFLRDDGVIEAIAGAIAPDKSHHLVEIGPGEGACEKGLEAPTLALIKQGANVNIANKVGYMQQVCFSSRLSNETWSSWSMPD